MNKEKRIVRGLPISVVLVVSSLVCTSWSAHATDCDTVLFLDFKDGLLPSAHGQIDYHSHLGVPEEQAYRVENGLLLQTLPIEGPTGYFFPGWPPFGGPLDPAGDIAIEVRLRVVSLSNAEQGGVWFGAVDSWFLYDLHFRQDGVLYHSLGDEWHIVDSMNVNVFDWHTYRLEAVGSECPPPQCQRTVVLSIDGVVVAAYPTAEDFTGWNGFRFGGGTSFATSFGDAEWEYVLLAQPIPPPPCPSDIDGDGDVGIVDLLILLAQWGPCSPNCFADLDSDGMVGIVDLLTLLASWGPCPCI